MSTFYQSTEAVTMPGDLDAIPWVAVKQKRELSPQLDLAISDDDPSFQDTVFLDDLPDRRCVARLSSLDFGESVSI